jgi:hypothetical protein
VTIRASCPGEAGDRACAVRGRCMRYLVHHPRRHGPVMASPPVQANGHGCWYYMDDPRVPRDGEGAP